MRKGLKNVNFSLTMYCLSKLVLRILLKWIRGIVYCDRRERKKRKTLEYSVLYLYVFIYFSYTEFNFIEEKYINCYK